MELWVLGRFGNRPTHGWYALWKEKEDPSKEDSSHSVICKGPFFRIVSGLRLV